MEAGIQSKTVGYWVLVDDDIGIGKGSPHPFVHRVSNGMGLKKGKVAIDLEVELDDLDCARLACAQIVNALHSRIGQGNVLDLLPLFFRQLSIHENLQCIAGNLPSAVEDEGGDEQGKPRVGGYPTEYGGENQCHDHAGGRQQVRSVV